jgi:hypothetical protein
LLSPSLSEWLPESPGIFVSEIINRLDLEIFYSRYEGDGRRNQPFDPAMLVKVLVYGYATGVFFCARWPESFMRMSRFDAWSGQFSLASNDLQF